MLVAQRVNDLMTSQRPQAICDKCICNELKFNSHAHAAQITGALGTTSNFDRTRGNCSMCKNDRIVIRALQT